MSSIAFILCPVAVCDGQAPVAELQTVPQVVWICPACESRFRVEDNATATSKEHGYPLNSLEIPTYEGEYARLTFTPRTRICLIGRLDVFSFNALQKAWATLEAPRRAVIDLRDASDLSQRGIESLNRFFPNAETTDGRAILVDAQRAHQMAGLTSRAVVFTDETQAESTLWPDQTEAQPLILVRVIEGH